MSAEARPVCVWGVPRSGTSWLGKIIESAGGLRYFFEPLHPNNHPETAAFAYRRYLREGSDLPELREFLGRLFDGRLDSDWMARHRNPGVSGRRPLIKCIRMNLMIDWVVTTFGVAGCVIVRQPNAVIGSRLRLGWAAGSPDDFLSQPELMADHLAAYRDVLRAARTPVEVLAVEWAVSTKVALAAAERHDLPLVRYEELCRTPEVVSRELFRRLDLPWHDSVSRFIHETSSRHEIGEFSVYRSAREMGSRETQLSPQHQREVARVCQAFGFDASER